MCSRAIVAVLLLVVLAVPAYAQTSGELTQGDVDAALVKRKVAGADLEALMARFDQAVADEEILREVISDLARSVSDLERDIGTKTAQIKDLVVSRYMAGGPLGAERLFTARTFTDLPIQDEYYKLMTARDVTLLRGLETSEKLHVEKQALLDSSIADQQALVSYLVDVANELSAVLTAADTEYNRVAMAFQKQEEVRKVQEEEERKRKEAARRAAETDAATAAAATSTTTTTSVVTTTTEQPHTTTTVVTTTTSGVTTTIDTTTTTVAPAPPPVVTDGKTCPINAANSFSDTWGAPRSGGRTHKGVDIGAARNAPVVAIESGTVTRTSSSSLGGLSIYLTGVSGSSYYYAHLEYIADGITGGAQVSVGDLLGGNGSSGNAPDWLPHVHFQYAPAGSDWVNPYPLVSALCR
ncbi:MAG: hypothetical protein BMS9Abin20_1261 [Acidimicrobiia bacterium]|nr:MAG: hypothetical protein BMS9Abin20_1261 [Acidimicrobiia bacterium]